MSGTRRLPPPRATAADLLSRPAWLWVWGPILLVSVAHYTTGTTHHWLHDIFRRLYYIPIVVGAFQFGRRGALAASGAASLIYLPHAFIHTGHLDPGGSVDKLLEILLYNVIALITGTLADREHAERDRQERLAAELRATLDDKRVMEEQLVRAGRLQALGELTAGLAHEIKNPLASMKGAAEIVADEIPEDSPRRRMVEILRSEVDRLTALLERFLAFARPVRLDPAPVNVCEVIEQTISLARLRSADAAGDRIEWDRAAHDVVVQGDREQVVQVVLNLVLNACQASEPDQGVVIRCGHEQRGRRRFGFITVEDSGPGIPEALRDKVFDPFYSTRDGGAGLGLSIAARIVDEHDGIVEVSDREGVGGGACFRVLLPLAEPAEAEAHRATFP